MVTCQGKTAIPSPAVTDRVPLPAMSASPSIVVGVTGHRSFPEPERVAAAVDTVLGSFETAGPGVVVSALADGADRLVARQALARPGWSLTAVLPMPLHEYLDDFDEASQWELVDLLDQAGEVEELEPAGGRDETYLQGGRHVVDRCDALVALWDGRPAFGRGGTADVVTYARDLGRPLAWISVANTIREPAGDAPGEISITWERWPWIS